MKPPKAQPITAADKVEAARKERLRLALPAAVELLRTRQAGMISATEIEEFVAMNWLEWHGGTLKLTVTGANVCSQGKTSSTAPRG
jgi:hypothetical protein